MRQIIVVFFDYNNCGNSLRVFQSTKLFFCYDVYLLHSSFYALQYHSMTKEYATAVELTNRNSRKSHVCLLI